MFDFKKRKLNLDDGLYYKNKSNRFLILCFSLMILLNLLNLIIGNRVVISGESMYPTLHNEESVFLNKIYYKVSKPKYNDLVVFKSHNSDDDFFVKRIIGLPGDTIEIKEGILYRNGAIVKESYLDSEYIDNFEKIRNSKFTFDFSLEEHAYDNSFDYLSTLKLSELKDLESENGLIKIPDNYYFVMGDNRPESLDSREIGLIDKESIEGKVSNFF